MVTQVDSKPAPLLWTAGEAAERLQISVRTLQQRTREGLIPCVRLGPKLVRYDPAALQRWIEAQRGDIHHGQHHEGAQRETNGAVHRAGR